MVIKQNVDETLAPAEPNKTDQVLGFTKAGALPEAFITRFCSTQAS